VSHIPQRKEKDCLNCGTVVQGKYCQHCGQENVEPKETFWHMFTHFFYDITHFDSSFFHTIHHLILKPGFLSKQYMMGRRASYLHPIQMYVFTSAIFFLLFLSFFKPDNTINIDLTTPLSKERREKIKNTLIEELEKDTANQLLKNQISRLADTAKVKTMKDMANLNIEHSNPISINGKEYNNRKEYDSVQHSLPAAKRDGWFTKKVIKKVIEVQEKFNENPQEAANALLEAMLHRMPYMLFISLPLFALILKLVYIRRKQFFFADHGVFTIHLYIFTFLWLLVVFSVSKLSDITHWGGLDFLIFGLFLLLFFYLYKAMRFFYGQGRAKTIIKFLLVAFWSLIMMLILFALFLLVSALIF